MLALLSTWRHFFTSLPHSQFQQMKCVVVEWPIDSFTPSMNLQRTLYSFIVVTSSPQRVIDVTLCRDMSWTFCDAKVIDSLLTSLDIYGEWLTSLSVERYFFSCLFAWKKIIDSLMTCQLSMDEMLQSTDSWCVIKKSITILPVKKTTKKITLYEEWRH